MEILLTNILDSLSVKFEMVQLRFVGQGQLYLQILRCLSDKDSDQKGAHFKTT